MEKYSRAGHAKADNIIQGMHFACWITKATDTNSEYVILLAFAQKQWLRESASIFHVHIHFLSRIFCILVKENV
jgi:hypothetical protein